MGNNKYSDNSIEEAPVSKHLHLKCGRAGICASTTFEITSRCNFSCKMCYVHYNNCAENEKGELTARQWIDIAKQAKEAGTLFVLITGGEPLLRSDFCEIYEAVSKMGFIVSINSNLSLLKDEHIELFKKYPPNRINASLYGMSEETYLDFSGVAACETVKSNIKRLQAEGIAVKINSSITPRNINDYEKICDFCEKEGLINNAGLYMFPASRLNVERERLSPEQAAMLRVKNDLLHSSPEKFADRVERIKKGIDFVENSDCIEVDPEKNGIRCRAGFSTSWIDWKGNMSFCGMLPASENNNVVEKGYAACWEQAKADAKAVALPDKCVNCKYKFMCSFCAASCYCETGAYNKAPDYVCRTSELTYKEYLKYSK